MRCRPVKKQMSVCTIGLGNDSYIEISHSQIEKSAFGAVGEPRLWAFLVSGMSEGYLTVNYQ